MTNEVGSWIPRTRANAHNKFPPDYLFELDAAELDDLRTKISSTKLSSKCRALPNAFTEKGLYMLATVHKSRRAVSANVSRTPACPTSLDRS